MYTFISNNQPLIASSNKYSVKLSAKTPALQFPFKGEIQNQPEKESRLETETKPNGKESIQNNIHQKSTTQEKIEEISFVEEKIVVPIENPHQAIWTPLTPSIHQSSPSSFLSFFFFNFSFFFHQLNSLSSSCQFS